MSMPQEPSTGGNIFTRKLGPLPMWAWMAVALVLAIAYYLYKKHTTAAASSATSNTSGTAANTPGGVDASLVPQFVNQTYTNSTPPAAPSVTVNNTVPAPATPAASTAKTISGAPGSYTTGLSGGLNEWSSTGKYSLNTIAKSHGMTAQQLIASSQSAENNPTLAAYVKKGNYNAPVPAGVQLFFPNANWTTVKAT
jgi:hypothetical protein